MLWTVISTDEDGTQNAWGPFMKQNLAEKICERLQKEHKLEAFVTVMITVNHAVNRKAAP